MADAALRSPNFGHLAAADPMLAEHGAGCLAVGAGRAILLDRPRVLEAADRAGIAIVGIGPDGPEASLGRKAELPVG